MSGAIDFMKSGLGISVLLIAVSVVSLILSFFGVQGDLPVDPAWIAIVLCGAPILWDAITGLVLRHDIKADVLVAMAMVAAVLLQEYFAAGEVALIMAIGALLEDVSADRASRGVERLVNMTPKVGRVITDSGEDMTSVEDIRIGQRLRVVPGEAVPVDGRIVSGETSIDQAVVTGESIPVDKVPGDEVYSGTINQMGSFDMVVTRTGEDSTLQRMAEIVSSVDADKTRMVRTADRWATYLVAIVLVLSVATFAVTHDIYRAVTVMIVFCPCAFILATPTAVVAAIGNLTKHGILVKDGDSLERMSSVDVMAFDKTGTITEGKPEVVDVSAVSGYEDFLSIVASAESRSEHPLGRAIVEFAKVEGIPMKDPESFEMTVGRGIRASVDGLSVRIGSMRMMDDSGIQILDEYRERAERMFGSGCTTVFASVDGMFAGTVSLSDGIRESVHSTVSELGSMGVECILLTGDNPRSAKHMASAAGISEYRAEMDPESKTDAVSEMQASGRKVCMVGDGVNDSPALRKAWVGIAMGENGSDIAVDAADMALIGDRMESIPHLVSMSRRMMGKIRTNIVFSLFWNFMAVALAMTAVLGPVEGALVHNIGSVIVVVNSALLLMYGRRVGGISYPDGSRARRDTV